MKRFLAFTLALLGAVLPSMAQESTPTITLPSQFNTAVTELQNVGTSAAQTITPMVLAVGGAFVVIGLIFVAIRFFTRSTRAR